MIRLFLAVSPPPQVRKAISKEISLLKKQIPHWHVNWVKPENLHLTLLFLGWVKEGQEKIIQKEVEEAFQDSQKFEITTGNLSYRSHPLWLEVSQGKKELTDLHKRVLRHLSFKESKDSRPFHPHLTLGRIKKGGRSRPSAIKKIFSWQAKEIILYQSQPRKTGSVYKELAAFPLKG
ncbi:MAG: RNA ligase/cyclic nucleotide phosphodiesterase [candidate division CPR1 bacterium GW2011_GWC1_49_13]|uniref:RNA 2',3'-cyclic phosphodiesterase n=1 Tax=candidate division CPR1 bacterium GW2011_GWC1_49_13 TaxID=1618342 RepID=A0A0G1VHJ0_9BACT|nr:MAG: RNA ligase/cyclic nucleotide phosphodiesterase [candidate division CPR1 bacterium GW2011_GWC1_49_13]